MHLPDGVLDVPTSVATAAVAAGAVGYSLYRVRRGLGSRTVPLLGVVSAFIFAAQMVNFPIPGMPVSGHLMGGVLAAAVLGPWGGTVAIALVLLVQMVVFYDGGLTALGANVLNMGVVGSMLGWLVYAPLVRTFNRTAGGWSRAAPVAAAVVAAWLAVVAASVLAAVEGAASGWPFGRSLAVLVSVHSLIGIGEALITGLVLAYVVQSRPDLLYGTGAAHVVGAGARAGRIGQFVGGGLVAALVIAAFVSPLASPLDDGLDSSMARLNVAPEDAEPLIKAPIEDYQMPGIDNEAVATGVAGIVGTLAVLGIAIGLAWRLRARGTTADALGWNDR